MVNIVIDILEDLGVSFQSSGICEYRGQPFKWYHNAPYKIYGTQTIDFFYEIKKDPRFKKAHQLETDKHMVSMFEEIQPEDYQIHINTQDLTAHSVDVCDFLDSYDTLLVQSPMATRKSNILEEVVKQCSERELKVIFITNRVSLSKDISKKYDIDNYQDFYTGEHLVCQFDRCSNIF